MKTKIDYLDILSLTAEQQARVVRHERLHAEVRAQKEAQEQRIRELTANNEVEFVEAINELRNQQLRSWGVLPS